MTRNVLVGMLAVSGLAAVASAQTNPPAGTAQLELRLVVDGSPEFASVLANLTDPSQIQQFLPGPAATAVGLTLQARVTTFGTLNNFGITGFQNLGASQLSRFENNDAVSAGQTSMRRGLINGTTLFGTFGNRTGTGLTPAYGVNGPGNFRGSLIGTSDATTNLHYRTADQNNAGSPGSTPANSRNGFVDNAGAGGTGRIIGLSGTVTTGDINLANFPQIPTGEASPWYNMYRLIFVPRANAGTDLTRNVTVTFTGGINFAYNAAFNEASGTNVAQTFTFGTAAAPVTTSATFQVPTPGAAALLGLGGLLAARRRRA